MADDVTLKVGADTSEAEKNLKNLERNSLEMSKTMGSAFGAIKAAAAAAVAVFAGKKVLDFFSSGIDAAIAQEQAMARLAQQLRLTGEFSDQALSGFERFAAEMEFAAGVSDDVILSQVALAKTFGVTNEQAETLTKAAIELSAATGKGLEESTRQLGKTVSGLAGELGETIPELRGMTAESLKSGAAFQLVLDRFSGSSAAKIETFAGSVKTAGLAFVNFQESIGKVITENKTVLAAVSGIRDIFIQLKADVEGNSSAINNGLTLIVRSITTMASLVIPAVKAVIDIFGLMSKVATVSIAGVVQAIAAPVTLIDKFTSALGGKRTKAIQDALDQVDAVFKFAADSEQVIDSASDGLAKYRDLVDQTAEKIFDADKKIGKSGKAAAGERQKAYKREEQTAKEREKALSDFARFEKSVTQENASAVEKLNIKRRDQLKELERFERDRVVTAKRAAELREDIDENYAREFKKIQDDIKEAENKRYEENIKALKRKYGEELEIVQANEKKKSKLFKDSALVDDQGNEIVVKTVLSDAAVSEIQGLGASIISGISQGAQGAASTISGAAGAIVSFFAGPGFGSIVREAINLGFQDPAENIKNVRGFFAEIPTLLQNFTENIKSLPASIGAEFPKIIEQLIGGLPDFLNALIESIFNAIGNSPELVSAIVRGISKALVDTVNSPGNFRDSVKSAGEAFKESVLDARVDIQRAGVEFNFAMIKAAKDVTDAWDIALRDITNYFKKDLPNDFKNAMEAIKEGLKSGFEQLLQSFGNFMNNTIATIARAFSSEFTKLWGGFFTAFVDELKRAFKNIGGGVVSGGSSNPLKAIGIGAASGLTEVPPGYPNDTFAARLSSGERVVDPKTNSDLKEFLASANAGGLGNEQIIALLQKIAGGGQTVAVELKLDRKTLAKEIFKLNYANERTA